MDALPGFGASVNLRRLFQRQGASKDRPCRRFSTRREVEQYVEEELRRVVPAGWQVIRMEQGRLGWIIEKKPDAQDIARGDWPHRDYLLEVSEDLEFFIILYDNNDVGGWSLSHALRKAMVISQSALIGQCASFELGGCVQYVMANCKSNEWGYT